MNGDAQEPNDLAYAMLQQVLATQWQRDPAVVLNSPPGAGKTGVAERLAAQGMGVMRERVMIATQTNEQAFDLMRRLCGGFPRMRFHMMAKETLAIPQNVAGLANISIVHDIGGIPNSPCVVVGNGAKWSWMDTDASLFDLQIIDEAYQLPDYRYHQIAGLATRHVLIGDPGQIDPVIQAELERWRCDPAGPHVAAPRALIERHPGVTQLSLPVSRRLVQDTIGFIQPAFYPDMPFVAMDTSRPLTFQTPGVAPMDTPLDAAQSGQSLVMVELPSMLVGDVDPDLADEIIWTVRRVLMRGATVLDRDGIPVRVTPEMIGIACAQVAQVHALRQRLGTDLAGVFVETANRFQGLERPLMFVQHPLSGRADATNFHLDAGRLCVLLSRHRVACWIFGREGISRQLRRYAPRGDRSLGISDDPEFQGWRANMNLMQALAQRGRIYPVPARGSGLGRTG